jgi:hypothetical protein
MRIFMDRRGAIVWGLFLQAVIAIIGFGLWIYLALRCLNFSGQKPLPRSGTLRESIINRLFTVKSQT